MKTKIFLSTLLSFIFCLLSSQVPQGFNYQAIALDASSSTPIKDATIQVRIILLSDTLANTIVWQELHNPVKTNKYGLFSLVIGDGARESGSAQLFSDIDWARTLMYVKTEIYFPSSWKTMKAAQLWSVPYSMVSGGLDGAIGKLEVVGDDVTSDEALFEVKRKDGETIFAVYNHGVRVYMPLDTLSKARKGGFAIGGFSKTKGTVQDYFVVNPDSIRAYIDTNPEKARKGGFAIGSFDKTKGSIQEYLKVSADSVRIYIDTTQAKARKGGFAIGGFSRTKGGNASFFNVSPDATENIDPSQNKILWYPLKNAFLTGRVLIEKPDSVGVNSFASGYESKAKGNWSQALGYKAIARGDYATAIGKNAVANDKNSFAFGNQALALSNSSYAFGDGVIAKGQNSFAFGSIGRDTIGNPTGVNTEARGDNSVAIGLGALATNVGSFAIGTSDTSSGRWATVLGGKSNASGDYSIAMGYRARTTGFTSLAVGSSANALGEGSTAIGTLANAKGNGSLALGVSNALGFQSIAIGSGTTAMSSNSIAFGNFSVSSSPCSMAIGYQTTASGDYATALTTMTEARGLASVALGHLSKSSGQYSLALGYYVNALGSCSSATGMGTISQQLGSFVTGKWNIPKGDSLNYNANYPLFIVGNGTDNSTRSNALEIYPDGHSTFWGRVIVTGPGNLISHVPDITLSEAGPGIPSNYWKEWTFKGQSKKLNIWETNLSGSNVRMTFADGGNVGIGTETPQHKLHIKGNGGILDLEGADHGYIQWFPLGFSNGRKAYIGFPNAGSADLVIRNEFTSGSDNIILQPGANGNVGIGISTPSAKLHIQGTTPTNAVVYLQPSKWNSVGDYGELRFGDINHYIRGEYGNGMTFYDFDRFNFEGANVGIGRSPINNKLEVEGNASKTTPGSWLSNSDERIKMNVQDIENAQETLMKLHPVKFRYTEEWRKRNPSIQEKFYYNFIAQEFREVFPESVQGSGEYIEGHPGEILQLDSYNVQIVSTKALQEVIEQNREQQQQIESYKSQLQSLQEEVEQIKAMLARGGEKK